jgi:lipoteichoic acid synthase
VAFRYPGNGFIGLPQTLADRGYETLSAVPFDPSFWNRRVTHAAYGFSRTFFAPDFAAGEVIGWGLNDRDFLAQMAPRLALLHRPFFALLITLSLHYPYDGFPDSHRFLDLGRWNGTRTGNYLQAMHFFDLALGEFVAALEREGLLDNTVLVVEGDHDAGLPWPEVVRVAGLRDDEIGVSLADRVPLVMRVPGGQAPRGDIGIVAGQTDLAPTLLALLGIDPAPFPYVGRNLLGEPGLGPVVRPYGDWVDATHLFVAGQGDTGGERCRNIAARMRDPVEACQAGQAAARQQIAVSTRVVTYGLQRQMMASDPRVR